MTDLLIVKNLKVTSWPHHLWCKNWINIFSSKYGELLHGPNYLIGSKDSCSRFHRNSFHPFQGKHQSSQLLSGHIPAGWCVEPSNLPVKQFILYRFWVKHVKDRNKYPLSTHITMYFHWMCLQMIWNKFQYNKTFLHVCCILTYYLMCITKLITELSSDSLMIYSLRR